MSTRRIVTVCVLLALVLLISAQLSTANAEPITAIYEVQITQRFEQQDFLTVTEPFDQQFEVRLTIDPANASPLLPFGPATFSPIPLETLPPPSDARTLGRTNVFAPPAGELRATAEERMSANIGQFGSYSRNAVLIGQSDVPLVLDAETFLMLLGGGFGRPSVFLYSSNLSTPGMLSQISFSGTASLQQIEPISADPIPEPATVALVGSGLVMLLRSSRAWRSKV